MRDMRQAPDPHDVASITAYEAMRARIWGAIFTFVVASHRKFTPPGWFAAR